MNRREELPGKIDPLDESGDVHYPEDIHEDSSETHYYDELAELDLIAVDPNIHREQEFLARKAYARAQRLEGLRDILSYRGRELPAEKQEKLLDYISEGDRHFKRAFGYEVMQAAALAQGESIKAFELEYEYVRSGFRASNRGKMGEARRDHLHRLIKNSNSPTKDSIEK